MDRSDRLECVNWILYEYKYFNLYPETACLAIHILERTARVLPNFKDNKPYITVAALFLACKYEEINPPKLQQLVPENYKKYKDIIINYEKQILKAIDYRLTFPTLLSFVPEDVGSINREYLIDILLISLTKEDFQNYHYIDIVGMAMKLIPQSQVLSCQAQTKAVFQQPLLLANF